MTTTFPNGAGFRPEVEDVYPLQSGDLVSSCCSANVYSPTKDWAQCTDCKEYCDVVDLSEEDEDYEEADFTGASDELGYANDR